jgi:hypothetical protein
MRFGRLLFGVAVIVLAVGIIVGEQISGVSSNAVVNARLSTVRTPISGVVDMPFRSFGTRVLKGEVLANATDPLVDTVRLDDLTLEFGFAKAEILRLEQLVAEAGVEIDQLVMRAETYQQNQNKVTKVQLHWARARVALLEGDVPATDAAAVKTGAGQLETVGKDPQSVEHILCTRTGRRIV